MTHPNAFISASMPNTQSMPPTMSQYRRKDSMPVFLRSIRLQTCAKAHG